MRRSTVLSFPPQLVFPAQGLDMQIYLNLTQNKSQSNLCNRNVMGYNLKTRNCLAGYYNFVKIYRCHYIFCLIKLPVQERDRHTGKQTDGWIDGRRDRQQTDGWTDTQTDGLMDGLRHTDRWADRLIDTNRQT